jgi:uncharacterized protein
VRTTMDVDSSSPVIALFTRVPAVGLVKTRLARSVGDVVALDLHRDLLERTIRVVIDSGLDAELWIDGDPNALPVHAMSVHRQRGGDLGERMLDIITQIVGRGRPAVVIGSDCPVIDAQYLRDAAAALSEGADVVIGPVEDGGYVLIGMSRPHSELLLGMSWSTATVHAETVRRANRAGLRTVVLRELWDIDDEAGLRRWKALGAATPDRRSSRSSE